MVEGASVVGGAVVEVALGRRPGLRVGVVPRAAGDHQGDEEKRGRVGFGAWPPFSSAPANFARQPG